MPKGINPPTVWQPRGRGFQTAVIAPVGRMVFLTGQVAWDAKEQVVGVGDVGLQACQCFENIALALAPLGGTLADVVTITTYYTDPAQLPLIQRVRLDYLDQAEPPVSTSVMVAGLGHPDFLVEMTPIAVIPDDRFIEP